MSQDDTQQQQAATNDADTIEVPDLDTFVKLVARWHRNKVARLEHFLQLPDGQVVQIGEEPEFTVTGDIRKGFLLGINMALMEFGILPFSFELEDAANDAGQQQLPLGDSSAG
jgi:hypothetical protein